VTTDSAARHTPGPVRRVQTPVGDPAWQVNGYREIKQLLLDPRLGRSHPQPQQAIRINPSRRALQCAECQLVHRRSNSILYADPKNGPLPNLQLSGHIIYAVHCGRLTRDAVRPGSGDLKPSLVDGVQVLKTSQWGLREASSGGQTPQFSTPRCSTGTVAIRLASLAMSSVVLALEARNAE
jgi:hypothetical protein